jgi:hypothetical protein
MRSTPDISRRHRFIVAVLVGLLFGGINSWLIRPSGPNGGVSDFLVYSLAGKALLAGADPYTYVPAHYGAGLFAPATIGVIAAPFMFMPAYVAAPVFFGIGCSVLAFAVTKEAWTRLLVFAAAPIWHAVLIAQITPLLVGAAFYPRAWGLLTAKPNIAIPLLAMQVTRRTIVYGAVSCAVILAFTFVFRLTWPLTWLQTIRSNPYATQYRIPILSAWGLVLWLPLLRWRRPEARLVFFMACMPQNFVFYEQLPLVLVPRSRRELMLVAVTSQIASMLANLGHGDLNFLERNVLAQPYVIVGVYLPAIILVMLRRNEGEMPAWIDQRVMRLPSWLRGIGETSERRSS